MEAELNGSNAIDFIKNPDRDPITVEPINGF